MISTELKQRLLALSTRREEHVRSCVVNDDHSHKVLAEDLYSDPTHFLFELIQNAEDEGAKTININLREDGLEFKHDGRAFDADDIESVTTFGSNERKKQKTNAIGRFGIGFKSVFSVTSQPRITSGGFEFTIRDFIVPEFDFDKTGDGLTATFLPFGDDTDLASERFESLDQALRGLDHRYILFLSNVQRIQWAIQGPESGVEGVLERSMSPIDGTTLHDVAVNSGGEVRQYVMGERPVKVPGKKLSAKVALLYIVEEERKQFKQVDASPLFAFFPTDLPTHLAFLVHAPFITTPARDNIQEKDGGVNQRLYDELAELLADMVQELSTVGRIDDTLWNILPCEKDYVKESDCYAALYQGLAKRCLTEGARWLKASTGRFVSAGEIQTSPAQSITALFTKEQSEQLFGRGYWLSADWVKSLDPDVRTFLRKELKVPSIEVPELKDHLTESFLENASDAWLTKLYGHIQAAKAFTHWKTEPIIRTQEGAHVAAFSKANNRTVFRPIEGGSEYPCVKETLVQGAAMLAFLDGMDIRPPKVIDEVTQLIIPKLKKKAQPYPKLKDHFKRILDALDEADPVERVAILKDLRTMRFLPARSGLNATQVLVHPDECYYPSAALRQYFHTAPHTLWLDTEYLDSITQDDRFAKFLGGIRLRSQPAKREVACHLSHVQKTRITGDGYITRTEDHELDHLPDYLTQLGNLKESVCLWNCLLAHDLPGRVGLKELLMGKIAYGKWSLEKPMPSLALEQLRTSKWLYNAAGVLSSPADLTIGELNSAYLSTTAEAALLIELLEFKADVAAAFEADHPNKKVVDRQKFERYEAWLQAQEEEEARVASRASIGALELLDVSDVEGEIEDLDEITLVREDDANHFHEPQVEYTPVVFGSQVKRTAGTDFSFAITQEQEDLGKWGEDWVEKILSERCATSSGLTLVALNNGDMLGVGRDFQIHRDSKLIEVIEVKTTAYDVDAHVKLSRRQWEQAMYYHKANGPVCYWLYCVFLANTRRPKLRKIKDPVAKLDSGALFVNDIVLRLTNEGTR